uniref:Putative secreted protein n=1 Tax=Anopheles darlingi TaxID=43151 RepID=A0A2M4D8B3_ANODA
MIYVPFNRRVFLLLRPVMPYDYRVRTSLKDDDPTNMILTARFVITETVLLAASLTWEMARMANHTKCHPSTASSKARTERADLTYKRVLSRWSSLPITRRSTFPPFFTEIRTR